MPSMASITRSASAAGTLSKLKRIGKTTRLKLVEVVDLIADERLTRDREPAK